MNTLKPSVIQMLNIGAACGLISLEEAFDNYMRHYDCFFLIEDFQKQSQQFYKELVENNLATVYDKVLKIKQITIEDARKLINASTN